MADPAAYLIEQADAHERIMDFVFTETGIHIWPQVRYTLFNLVKEQVTAQEQAVLTAPVKAVPAGTKMLNKIAYWYAAYRNRPQSVNGTFDGLVFSMGGGCIFNGQKAESRVNDFFNSFGDLNVLNLYTSHKETFYPVYNGKHVCYYDLVYLKAIYAARYGKAQLSAETAAHLEGFIMLLRSLPEWTQLLDEAAWIRVKSMLEFHAKALQVYKGELIPLLKKWSPRFIVLEDGNYGGQSYLLKWAKELGIITIEVQHGVFDVAYMYGDALLKNKTFADYRPDYLLTYGRYWNDLGRLHAQMVDIGYPYLEDKSVRLLSKNEVMQDLVLFISQGRSTPELPQIARSFAGAAGEQYRIVYRLHPSENENNPAYEALKGSDNIELSVSGDIYELVSRAAHIVGSYSFMLFEADLFGKPVHVHANAESDEYIPASLGTRFTDAAELHRHILQGTAGAHASSDYYWTKDWRRHAEDFVNHTLRK